MGTGGLAQLGEHLLCKQGVVGSIPSSSTTVPDMVVVRSRVRCGEIYGARVVVVCSL